MFTQGVTVYPAGAQEVAAAATVALVTIPVANALAGVAMFAYVTAGPATAADLVVSLSSNGTDFAAYAAKKVMIGRKMNSSRDFSHALSAVTTGYIPLTGLAVDELVMAYVDFSTIPDTTTHVRLSAHNGGGTAITFAACAVGDGVSYT